MNRLLDGVCVPRIRRSRFPGADAANANRNPAPAGTLRGCRRDGGRFFLACSRLFHFPVTMRALDMPNLNPGAYGKTRRALSVVLRRGIGRPKGRFLNLNRNLNLNPPCPQKTAPTPPTSPNSRVKLVQESLGAAPPGPPPQPDVQRQKQQRRFQKIIGQFPVGAGRDGRPGEDLRR